MAITSHRQLRFWQLLDELRRRIIAFTSRAPAWSDREYCSSARRTISAACRNTAEGFGRYSHPEFAQHVKIALGELAETCDHLDEALERQFISSEEHSAATELAEHAKATGLKLHQHLRRSRAPAVRT